MLGAMVVYRFDLKMSEMGDITPQFVEIAKEARDELRTVVRDGTIMIPTSPTGTLPTGIISLDDIYGLFFNLTTGNSPKNTVCDSEVVEQNLQDSPYKVLSHFFQSDTDQKYLLVAFFDITDTVDEYYPLFNQVTCRIEVAIRYAESTQKNKTISGEASSLLIDRLSGEIKNTMAQVERLYNLTKIQKIALIFSSPERIFTLRELRKGPVSRARLQEGLFKYKKNPNVDGILKPFLELNIVRRDWVKAYLDKKTKQKFEEGEYFFLVRDIALIRKHPEEILSKVKKDGRLAKKYETRIIEYFQRYNPFGDLMAESQKLARYLLDWDLYDLLSLLRTQYYPMEKFPKIIADMGELEELITRLREDEIVYVIQDEDKRRWVCLLNEIVPLITYPEYLIGEITEKTHIKRISSNDEKKPQFVRELSPEVAKLALKILQSSYYEQIEA